MTISTDNGNWSLGCHPTKDASFNILNLADQLHQSKSTNSDGLEKKKIYFSENPVPDLVTQGQEAIFIAVYNYTELLKKQEVVGSTDDQEAAKDMENKDFIEAECQNEKVNEIFHQAREFSRLDN